MDIFAYAVQMEQDGEKYYIKLAKMNEANGLHNIFTMLADDEKKHAQIIQQQVKQIPVTTESESVLVKAKNVFHMLPTFYKNKTEIPPQVEAYRLALKMEQDSIDLYESLQSKMEKKEEKELLHFLIQQENDHYRVLNELIDLLNHADDWVESPEFGIREEY